jgi:hypothetical protein
VAETTEQAALQAAGVPDNGDYLTDGRRLVLVRKVHSQGSIEVEDAIDGRVMLLGPYEYEAEWRVVNWRRPIDGNP